MVFILHHLNVVSHSLLARIANVPKIHKKEVRKISKDF